MEFLPEERIRRKAFVHYDVQSVGINFMEATTKRQNSVKQGMFEEALTYTGGCIVGYA